MIGTVVIFPENEIVFFQDHGWWKGVPDGIEFTVWKESNHFDFWLEAEGFGKIGNYGGGKIAVRRKDIEWALNKMK